MRTVTFSGRFENLPKVSKFICRAAKEAGLNTTACYEVELAVDEAFTNIVEHAYGGDGLGDIQCSYNINGNGLTVILRDHGRPFDPSKIPAPNLNTSLKELKPGGAGLFLIHKLMDEVYFEFTPGAGNKLTLVKHRTTK